MSFKSIFKGTLTAFLAAIVSLIILSVLVYTGTTDEKTASIICFAALSAAALVGALISASSSERRHLPNALCVSMILSIAAAAISYSFGGTFDNRIFAVIGALFATGFLGALFRKRS